MGKSTVDEKHEESEKVESSGRKKERENQRGLKQKKSLELWRGESRWEFFAIFFLHQHFVKLLCEC